MGLKKGGLEIIKARRMETLYQMQKNAKFYIEFYHPSKQWMIFSSYSSYSTGIHTIGDFFKVFKIFKNNLYYLNFISQYKDIHPKTKVEFFDKHDKFSRAIVAFDCKEDAENFLINVMNPLIVMQNLN